MAKFFLFILSVSLVSIISGQKDILYSSKKFQLYPDKVIQDKFIATVHSANHISSNYQSDISKTFPRLVVFKVSVNEKDNEMKPGMDHWLLIQNEHQSPVIGFGEKPLPKPEGSQGFLPENYEYTFRFDMTKVIEQFESKGFFEAYDGSKISKNEFKGFFLAGGSEPLSWDFVNLKSKGLKLIQEGSSNIYSIKLILNPTKKIGSRQAEWKLSKDISKKPSYKSDQPLVDALFNLSLEEAIINIEKDSTFRTGAKWAGVWTRDISYSILLAFAYHEPEIAKISLRKKVKRNRIIQDTGSGGAWPISSDRTTWALAAWEIYKVTGDELWLKEAYQVIKNTLEDDVKTIYNPEYKMYGGESSFLDWREQTYPKWMSNSDIFQSMNLGTNAVHYRAHIILAEMAKILNEPSEKYQSMADEIKSGVNLFLWNPQKGYYSQYLYGRANLMASKRFEALGESLSILFNVSNESQSRAILSRAPLTDFGVTCIFPQIPNIPPYHNNSIWPFVQSFWNLAAAKGGNEKVLEHGLASLYRSAGLFLTNYENMVATTGDFEGTEINSDRMLWSMAGNLAMVHRVFIGMNFEVDGILFSPVIPKSYQGNRSLKNFKYRNSNLNIKVEGYGNTVLEFYLDGKKLEKNFCPGDLKGKHDIKIVMANNDFSTDRIKLVDNSFSLPNPQVQLSGNKLSWDKIETAKQYIVYRDKLIFEKTQNSFIELEDSMSGEYSVSAIDMMNVESFRSEPILFYDASRTKYFQIEEYAPKSSLSYNNYQGNGFVEISTSLNKEIKMDISLQEEGDYLIDFRYSNGNGPWNTDNKCAVRSLFLNNEFKGAMVFPQRGVDEWSDWGFSNMRKVKLQKGKNTFKLIFEETNNNMNVAVNAAMLDYLRIIKM
jgi:hypothetical protein